MVQCSAKLQRPHSYPSVKPPFLFNHPLSALWVGELSRWVEKLEVMYVNTTFYFRLLKQTAEGKFLFNTLFSAFVFCHCKFLIYQGNDCFVSNIIKGLPYWVFFFFSFKHSFFNLLNIHSMVYVEELFLNWRESYLHVSELLQLSPRLPLGALFLTLEWQLEFLHLTLPCCTH